MNLTLKYRLIWDTSTLYIQNEYDRDYTGSVTRVILGIDSSVYESDIYQDILDKITQEDLQIDPSLN